MRRAWLPLLLAFSIAAVAQETPGPVDSLIRWLLQNKGELRDLPFARVIADATGRKVIPIDRRNETDRRMIAAIARILDQVVRRMNDPANGIHKVARINEVSSHFEDLLRELLNTTPGLSCDFPRTAEGEVQRSGYPDLRIIDQETKRIFYLDPKLYAAGSRESSFRTFYFEPKQSTNKVLDDAVHLVVGFEHEPRRDGRWKFTRWDLIDLASFRVKLKPEFQASNRDLYRREAIVATSAK